jgi:ATP-dependent RNA helicase DBP3
MRIFLRTARTICTKAKKMSLEKKSKKDMTEEERKQRKLEKKRKRELKENEEKKENEQNSSSVVSSFERMSLEEGNSFRAEHSISVEGMDLEDASPIRGFSESGINPRLLEITKDFTKPTPIQAQCIPILMKGQDCVGIAATGSGKTLAFGLPGLHTIIEKIKNCAGKKGVRKPQMLVVAPTRELAMQSAEVLQKAAGLVQLKSICIYGGMKNQREQLQAFKHDGLDLVVATPGRLLGLIEDFGPEAIDLSEVSYLVLDEADRMLDMGFEPDIRKIFSYCSESSKRQTVMFSATWPVEIRKLASEFLNTSKTVRVVVGSVEATANTNVTQHVEVIDEFGRDRRLLDLLRKYSANAKQPYRILVFALYKKEAARLEGFLAKNGFNCGAIHGDKGQNFRIQALQAFSSGNVPILVATDIAARGLDIPMVELVLNYSFPLTIEDYIHRIGRTGRAGNKGIAHTFFTVRDKHLAGEFSNVLTKAGVEVPEDLKKFGTAVKKKTHGMYGDHFKAMDGPMPKSKKIKFDD